MFKFFFRKKVPPNSLYGIVFQAKEKERYEVFKAFKEALENIGIDSSNARSKLFIGFENQEGRRSIFLQKISRFFDRLYELDKEKATSLHSEIKNTRIDIHFVRFIKKELKGQFSQKVPSHIGKAMLQEIEVCFDQIDERCFTKSYNQLTKIIVHLITLIEMPFDPTGERNRKILFTLRKALTSLSYQFLKENEKHPAVQLLHSLCFASYIDPKAMNAFNELGQALYTLTLKHESEEEFHTFLRSSHKHLEAGGLIKNDLSFAYAKYFFPQLWVSLFSLYLGRLLSFFGFKGYDPRGDIQNNPTALYDEVLEFQGKDISIRTSYTPSPSVGDQVAPEAHALLMAMENRHFFTDDELQKDPYPYLAWAYTNLQNRGSYNEGFRSQALMELGVQYPFSFRGITLSQDLPFYRAQVKISTRDKEPLNEKYRDEFFHILSQPENFILDSKMPRAGYYFAKTIISEETLEKICHMAYSELSGKKKPDGVHVFSWNWKLKAAFREYVTLGIIKYFQVKVALELVEKSKNCKLLASNACKEGIDRGGKVNATLLWGLGAKSKLTKSQVFQAFHLRALLSRNRLVLLDRVEPMLALVEVVKQEELNRFLKMTTAQLHAESDTVCSC